MALLKYFIVFISVFVCVLAIVGPASNGTKSTADKTDSYLEAYSKSRIEAEKAKQGVVIITAKDGEKKISNRDDSFSGYDYSSPYSGDSFSSSGSSSSSSFSGAPSSNYLPSPSYNNPVKFESEITYNAPANTYGPPVNTYGPPAQSYGPPAHTYGPPAQIYGPPAQNYGPPKPIYGPPLKPSYGVPYTAPGLSFLDKFAFKLDLLTVGKLILKFLIFKKIVTMIAVICMLLVIPKLISFKKDDGGNTNNDEEYRNSGKKNPLELTSLHQMVERAVKVYGQQRPECGIACRVRSVIDDFYEFQPYFRVDSRTS